MCGRWVESSGPGRHWSGLDAICDWSTICILYRGRRFREAAAPDYGKANRRNGDREGHHGVARHKDDPVEVAGGLQPRFQDRPVHYALLARHPDLQTRLLAVVLRARSRFLRDDGET